MTFGTASPFEPARLDRIKELVTSTEKLKMDCADLAALERRITALERGLPRPSRERDDKVPMAANLKQRRVWRVCLRGSAYGRLAHLAAVHDRG